MLGAATLVILLRYLVQPRVIYATGNNIMAGHEYELCPPRGFSLVLQFILTYLILIIYYNTCPIVYNFSFLQRRLNKKKRIFFCKSEVSLTANLLKKNKKRTKNLSLLLFCSSSSSSSCCCCISLLRCINMILCIYVRSYVSMC